MFFVIFTFFLLYCELENLKFNLTLFNNMCIIRHIDTIIKNMTNKESVQKYHVKNRELINKKARERYHKNRKKSVARVQKYYQENKELVRQRARNRYDKQNRHDRYIKNRERDLNQCKKYRLNNIEKYREYQRNWTNHKRATDPHYAIQHRLRNRLLAALKEGKGIKQASFKELIGCSLEELKLHIENQFTENMSWEEFHKGNVVIDHKKPCCAFDLTKKEEQLACFHYTNLQPLWEEDNYKKIKEDLKQSIRLNAKKTENTENIDF